MTRLGYVIFCAALGTGLVLHGCGGGGSGGTGGSAGGGAGGGGGGVGGSGVATAIVPVGNEVSGWAIDTAFNAAVTGWPTDRTQPAVANNLADATALIDGGASGFYTSTLTPNVFVFQNYLNTSFQPADGSAGYQLGLYVMQMPSVAQATSLYTSLLDGTHSLYNGTWTDPTSPAIGDASRILNTGTDWWINFRKGVYYAQVRLTYAESTDTVGQQQTLNFATAVAAKM